MKTARQPLTFEKRIYETNGKKYDVLAILSGFAEPDKVHHESCLLCGFKIPNAGHSYMIHMLNGGFGDDQISLLRCDEPELWDSYPSQGGFPIGSECRKKLPKEFTLKVKDLK